MDLALTLDVGEVVGDGEGVERVVDVCGEGERSWSWTIEVVDGECVLREGECARGGRDDADCGLVRGCCYVDFKSERGGVVCVGGVWAAVRCRAERHWSTMFSEIN